MRRGLKPLHGVSVLLEGSRHAQLRDKLIQGYHASQTPNEQRLLRMLGQAYFGVDMLYDELPKVRPRSWTPPSLADIVAHVALGIGL